MGSFTGCRILDKYLEGVKAMNKNKIKPYYLVVPLLLAIIFFAAPLSAASNSSRVGIPIITKQMAENNDVVNNFIKTQGKANGAFQFKTSSSKSAKGARFDVYETLNIHSENKAWEVEAKWYAGDLANYILRYNDLTFKLYAELQSDEHSHPTNHWDKKTDRAYLKLWADNKVLLELNSDGSVTKATDEELRPKESGYAVLKKGSSLGNLWLTAGSMDCECGSSAVSRVSVAIIDETVPVVTSVEITGQDGKKTLKEGETGTVKIRFNEPIRFAYGSNYSFPIYLSLADGQGRQLDKTLPAYLNTPADVGGIFDLTFTFTMPADLDQDCYISGLAASQPDLFKKTSLKIYQGYSASDGYSSLVSYTSTGLSIEEQLNRGVSFATSVITDLAGNSLESLSYFISNPAERIRLDKTPPKIDRIDFVNEAGLPLAHEGELDRSAVYAGIGRELSLQATFDEKVIGSGTTTATLNINKDGNPVTISGSLEQSDSGKSYLKFEPFTITGDMVMADGHNGEQIKILGFAFHSSYQDVVSNKPISGNQSVFPVQEIYLDNISPEVTEIGSPSYTGDRKSLLLYFNITDSGAKPSGVMLGEKGSLAWEGEGGTCSFQYAVTTSSTVPEKGWRTGTYHAIEEAEKWKPFTQFNGPSYLHIKLNEIDDANIYDSKIILRVKDWAGNEAERTVELTGYATDVTPPEISVADESLVYKNGDPMLQVPVTVRDASGFNSIAYQWTVNDDKAAIQTVTFEPNSSSFSFLASSPTITEAVYNTLYLQINAVDMRDNEANPYSKTYEFIKRSLKANVSEVPDPFALEVGGRLQIGSPVNNEESNSQ